MGYFYMLFLVLASWVWFISASHGLQTSQTQVLLQLRKLLEYPPPLEAWENYNGDLCSLASTAHMSISCMDNSVTQLKIMGDKHVTARDFNGYAISNKSLSESFSIDSFVTTLTRLPSLRVLSLVSLGIWGPLPNKIHRLSWLEVLDMSSNFIYGSIPVGISRLAKLQILIMDENYFNGTIPDSWDSLSNLTILSFKSNRINGRFPSSICKIATLSDIALSHNELSGKLPNMSALTNLHVLDLRENKLDSELPSMPKGLITALLSRNSFTGEIPLQFEELRQLQHLDLSFNHLSGTPPSILFALPSLSYLHLASNLLSGSLLHDLTCGSKLGFVDISNNKLIGGVPSCLNDISGKRVVKYSGNCLSVVSQHQNQESYCREANSRNMFGRREIGLLVGIIMGAILVLVLLGFGIFIFRRRYHSGRSFAQLTRRKSMKDTNLATGVSSNILANARLISQAAKLGTQGAPVYRVFNLEELKEGTNNFDSSSFMGGGSKGKLYKGRLENGTYVAIRSLALSKKNSIRNLKIRLDFLSKLQHPHLVGLLGHCIEGGELEDSTSNKVYLVYEYVPNGNYRTHLSENSLDKVLKWPDRLAILIGVAKAVHFLHTGIIPGCFDNWLRTNNILLDEHRIAKLSDYGMYIIMDENEKFESKEGHKPCQKPKMEDDVYNFGFILLESLVGPTVTGKGEAFLLNEMTSFGSQDGRKRIVDPAVLMTCSQESLSIVVSITNKCISPEPSSRPSFEDVLWNLQYAAQVQATADADQRSDSTL